MWVLASGVFMFGVVLALDAEMADYPGGPEALAESIAPTAEAMRIMRWPADRLDTLGGYLTYHNVILLNLALAIYGAVQGVRAVRGLEERRVGEELLATGVPRSALLRDRALGFAGAVLVIVAGLAVSTTAGLILAGAPDLPGVLITMGTSGLVAMVGFALGLALSQVLAAGRSAAGVASMVLVALYVITNLGGELGPLAALRWLSPFHYANQSRALVPGQGLDPVATTVLAAMVLGLTWLASVAFERRDYAAALWARRPGGGPTEGRGPRVPTALLGTVWTAALRQGAVGLLAWAAGAAAITGTFAAIQPSVMEVWTALDYVAALVGGGSGMAPEDMYWAFTGEMVAPLLAAYTVVRASGWVADLAQGRVEMLLAGPVSWSRLVVERWATLVVGTVAITVTAVGTLIVLGQAVGGSLDPAGVVRLAAMCVLFGAGLGGLGAFVVAWVRRPAAVTVLATFVAASYLLTLLVALFEWPEWLNRLSVFWAFGHPYLEWPPASAFILLGVLAVGGTVLATRVAERSAKVA